MGKVRRQRRKFHVSRSQSTQNDDQDEASVTSTSTFKSTHNLSDPIPSWDHKKLAELQKGHMALSSDLGDLDTQSVVSVRSTKSSCTERRKLDRRKERRQYLLERLNIRKSCDDAAAAQRKRRHTAVVGDMQPLSDALPSLEWLQGLAEMQKEKEKAEKNSKKQSNLQKKMVNDLSTFMSIAQHKEYQQDMFNLVGVSVQERLRRSAAGEDEP